MPRIEGQPGEYLREVWVYLSQAEARELLAALHNWAEKATAIPNGITTSGRCRQVS